MGGSVSKSSSQQLYNGLIAQQYTGTCDVECSNNIDGASVVLIDSNVRGGLNFTQTCNANSQCMVASTMDAVSDVLFTAANSSNAKSSGLLQIIPSVSSTSSLQSIQSDINDQVNTTCDTTSANSINNVKIVAVNSGVSGGINVGQSGSANGNCQLNNSMTASSYATGTANNCSTSGGKKKKKKGCSGKNSKGSKGSILNVIIVIIIIVIVVFIARSLSKPSIPVNTASVDPMPIAQPTVQPTVQPLASQPLASQSLALPITPSITLPQIRSSSLQIPTFS